MKTLLIMRHAKSDWSTAGQEDVDRVLNKRGRNDLPRMGQAIAATIEPQRILASSAARARETAEGVAAFLPHAQIQFDDGLYLASPSTLHTTLAQHGGEAETVMVVAHNPGMDQWVGDLCGAQIALPTAGLACIDFGASDWKGINRGAGQLRFYLIPRLLKSLGM